MPTQTKKINLTGDASRRAESLMLLKRAGVAQAGCEADRREAAAQLGLHRQLQVTCILPTSLTTRQALQRQRKGLHRVNDSLVADALAVGSYGFQTSVIEPTSTGCYTTKR